MDVDAIIQVDDQRGSQFSDSSVFLYQPSDSQDLDALVVLYPAAHSTRFVLGRGRVQDYGSCLCRRWSWCWCRGCRGGHEDADEVGGHGQLGVCTRLRGATRLVTVLAEAVVRTYGEW